jgi:hypothetical protein
MKGDKARRRCWQGGLQQSATSFVDLMPYLLTQDLRYVVNE